MQKESDAAAAEQHSVSVFLARRCFFRSRRRSATLSLGLSVRQRARAIPRLLHARLRLLSRGARYLTVKIYGEGKPARAQSSSGGTRRERNLREKSTPLKRMNREPTACPSPRNFRTKIVTGTRRRVLVESIPYRARYIYTRAL